MPFVAGGDPFDDTGGNLFSYPPAPVAIPDFSGGHRITRKSTALEPSAINSELTKIIEMCSTTLAQARDNTRAGSQGSYGGREAVGKLRTLTSSLIHIIDKLDRADRKAAAEENERTARESAAGWFQQAEQQQQQQQQELSRGERARDFLYRRLWEPIVVRNLLFLILLIAIGMASELSAIYGKLRYAAKRMFLRTWNVYTKTSHTP